MNIICKMCVNKQWKLKRETTEVETIVEKRKTWVLVDGTSAGKYPLHGTWSNNSDKKHGSVVPEETP